MKGQMNKRLIQLIRFSPLLILLILYAAIAIIDSSVLKVASVVQILVQSSTIVLLAMPVMVFLISGNMDMSASYGTSFYAVLLGKVLDSTGSLAIAVAATCGAALLVGIFNGIFVGIFEVPSFIVTLASMSIIQGLLLVTASTKSIIITNSVLKFIGAGKLFGIPMLLIYTAVIVALVWFIMRYTRFGANVYALGCNLNAARVSGVNIVEQQIKIFVFSALFTALTSITLAARVSIVSPSIGGTTFLLNAVTACIIGGTSSSGGKGTVWGAIAGAITVGTISFIMTAFGVVPNLVSVVQATIVIAALLIDVFLNRLRESLERGVKVV